MRRRAATVTCGGEIVCAFLRGEAAQGVCDGLPEVWDCPGGGGPQEGFELGEGHFDWIEVRTVGRQVAQTCAGGLDRLPDAMDLVSGQIVHDDDVALPQLGNQRLFDIGEEGLAVHWAIQNHGRGDAIVAKPGGEGGCFPMAVGHGGPASLAPRRTAVKAGHLGVRGGLIDEDDPRGIEIELSFKPSLTRRVHRAAALFGGVRRLFLRVILRRLKNRQRVPMATATPRSLRCSRSSARVMSLSAATAVRINSACASIRCEWRSPPWRFGLTSPCRRSCARHRIALDALTPNR
jgi:hypothetical protein